MPAPGDRTMRRFTTVAAAAAVVITSLAATPAEARKRHGGWGHRHHDRISTGDVLGGLLILGTIAAIASSANKDRQSRRDNDRRYDPPYRGERDRRDAPDYVPDQERQEVPVYGRGEAEARAADACSWAVEAEMGDEARVESITDTQPSSSGWYVTGTASDLSGALRSFGCRFEGGRVVDVRFG